MRGVPNLRDYFQSRGYFDVYEDFQQRTVNPDRAEITYVVDLGERQKLANIDVTGNRYFQASAIRERMYLQPAGFIRLRHGRYSNGFMKRDEEAVRALYRDNGFRDCKVTTRVIPDYKGKK